MYNNALFIKNDNGLLIRINSFNLKEEHVGCKVLLRKEIFLVDESFSLNHRIAIIKKTTTENIVVKMESNNVSAIVRERDIECLLIELKKHGIN